MLENTGELAVTKSARRARSTRSRRLAIAMALSAGALLAGGLLSAASAAQVPAKATSHGSTTVHESLVVLTGGMTDHPGWPQFVGGARINLPAHATVVLTIYSYDDGAAPLAKGLPYDKVEGTKGGTETVNGKTVSSIDNAKLAHTFTVPGMRLNIPIPVAPTVGKNDALVPEVVTATFTTGKAGTYTWQCYAPCGSGSSGDGGPMMAAGYMTGKVVVG